MSNFEAVSWSERTSLRTNVTRPLSQFHDRGTSTGKCPIFSNRISTKCFPLVKRKCIQCWELSISMLDYPGAYHQHLSIVKQQDSHGFRHSDTYDSDYIATNFNTKIRIKFLLCVWLILLESHIQNWRKPKSFHEQHEWIQDSDCSNLPPSDFVIASGGVAPKWRAVSEPCAVPSDWLHVPWSLRWVSAPEIGWFGWPSNKMEDTWKKDHGST